MSSKSPGAAFHRRTRYGLRGRFPPAQVSAGLSVGRANAPGEAPSAAGAKPVDLPPPEGAFSEGAGLDGAHSGDIWEILRARRSVRGYAEAPLSIGALSRLVWAAGGETGRREHGFAFRTTPSAGALYPIDTYVSCRSVEGVEPGIYRYRAAGHLLEPVRAGDSSRDLAEAALGQAFVARAAVVFVWTALVERCTVKYSDRGYRYIYMEAGVASENVHLAATAMGLGSCAIGAFHDGAVDALVGIDGREEIALLMQCVGAPAPSG